MSAFFYLAEDEGEYSSQSKGNTGGTGHQCQGQVLSGDVFASQQAFLEPLLISPLLSLNCAEPHSLSAKAIPVVLGGLKPESLQAVQRSEETAFGRLGSEKRKSR